MGISRKSGKPGNKFQALMVIFAFAIAMTFILSEFVMLKFSFAEMVIYPAKGQTAEQPQKDEYGCHKWAVEQTGFDPTKIQHVPQQPEQKQGGVVRGGAKGALLGAGIGAIAGDAGKGAAIGAATGGAAGGIRQRRQNRQQVQTTQQAQADQQAQLDQYNKAKATCLEAKGYKVSW